MNEIWYQPEEKAMFALRALWRSRGYLPFEMSKFEEYDLYASNKDFLVSDGIITFTDKTGRLLALKPDVTLSIVKNYSYSAGSVEKVYYHEHVYRPSGSTGEYKEILQSGLECIGALDLFQTAEVVSLAARSLHAIGENSVLAISHLGILAALLEECGVPEALHRHITACIAAKSAHELHLLCTQQGIGAEAEKKLQALITIHGSPAQALSKLQLLSDSKAYLEALEELTAICAIIDAMPFANNLYIDFSIVQDLRYYSGIVFRGYLPGIPDRVLSGGRYDRLVAQLGKQGGAIGFAVYLDLLEQTGDEENWDADVLLLYGEGEDPAEVLQTVDRLSADGARVMAQKSRPDKLRFGRVLRMRDGGVFDETND